jgi:hypothetical protein
MVKSVYINKAFEGKRWSWTDAINKFRKETTEENIRRANALDATGTFATQSKDDYFENSIIRGITNSVEHYARAGGYVNDVNNRLGIIVLKNADIPDTTVTAKRQYIKTTESNIIQVVRESQREVFRSVFIPTNHAKYNNVVKQVIERALGDVSFHYINEQYAKTLKEVPSRNDVYTALMEKFTALLKFVRPGTEENDFVLFQQIGLALKTIKTSISGEFLYLNVYKDDFNKALNLIADPAEVVKINKQIEDIMSYFKARDYLVDITESEVKAILGFFLVYKYENKTIDDAKKRMVYLEDRLSLLTDVKQRNDLRNLQSVANKIATQKGIKKLLNVLYPKTVLANMSPEERKKTEKRIKDILGLVDMIDGRLKLNQEDRVIWDTYEEGVAEDDKAKFEKLPTVAKWIGLSDLIDKLGTELKEVQKEQENFKANFF